MPGDDNVVRLFEPAPIPEPCDDCTDVLARRFEIAGDIQVEHAMAGACVCRLQIAIAGTVNELARIDGTVNAAWFLRGLADAVANRKPKTDP
jgi:hypothetical protein